MSVPNTDHSGAAERALGAAACAAGVADFAPLASAMFHVECRGPDGAVKWAEEARNVVTTTGKQLMLDVFFGATAKPSWFMLLKGAGTPAKGDTLASHATWPEVSAYAGNRPAVTFTASTVFSTTGAQVTHAAAIAFAINADNTTVAGLGICNAATGTAGTLYNAADFASSRTLGNGDTLNVTATLQQTP